MYKSIVMILIVFATVFITGDNCFAWLTIHYKNTTDLLHADAGFHRAQNFFNSLGFYPKCDITITFVDKAYIGNKQVFAWSDGATGEIQVTKCTGDFYKTVNHGQLFGIGINDDIFTSIIAHEVAHCFAYNILNRQLKTVLNEYIAYTTQLATMSQIDLKRILQANKILDPFTGVNDLSLIIYALAPQKFGIKCYLQFEKDKGALFIKILQGKVTAPDERSRYRSGIKSLPGNFYVITNRRGRL